LPISIAFGKLAFMEKLISIDSVGRTVLPKAIREAVNLGKGGPARVRLAPGGIIQIEPVTAEGRRLKKVGKFLVAVSDGKNEYDAADDVRAERDSR
jgi:bifunctional DNA-binding transcriptional regulator/antitoxin component of YhaV-PrlF toxin-antitoxin module